MIKDRFLLSLGNTPLANIQSMCRVLYNQVDTQRAGFRKGPNLLGEIRKTIVSAQDYLPRAYHVPYIDPLKKNLVNAITGCGGVEVCAGAVYQHLEKYGVQEQLRQFSAVVSDLWSPFDDGQKLPELIGKLPPLAVFDHAATGPIIYTVDETKEAFGAGVGVAALPSYFREHPLLWGVLAHEVGGHAVVHADPSLLPELKSDLWRNWVLLAPPSSGPAAAREEAYTYLWSHWIDEAAADVYGILNIGPVFALGIVVYESWKLALLKDVVDPDNAMMDRVRPRLEYGQGHSAQGTLDPHPPDVLRLHVAIGAINALNDLDREYKTAYTKLLRQLAADCVDHMFEVTAQRFLRLSGDVPDSTGATRFRIEGVFPLDEMAERAEQVGRAIMQARLFGMRSRGKRSPAHSEQSEVSIQEIETWNDEDQAISVEVADYFCGGHPWRPQSASPSSQEEVIPSHVDDAHLLAGLTEAVLAEPTEETYEKATRFLQNCFSRSFRTDRLWGSAAAGDSIVDAAS